MANQFSIALRTPGTVWKGKKVITLKDDFPRSVGAQYTTGEEWKNSSRKNEKAELKWKQCPVVDVSGGENKDWYCKEQYCIGTWNVRSMNQGKLDVVKPGDGKIEHQHLRNQWIKMDGIDRWMAKEVVVHIHNGILLSYKKECIWVCSNEEDEPRAYYTERSKSERERQISYINAYIWNLER